MPKGVYDRKPLLERLESKYEIYPSGCWIWTAYKCKGYGKIGIGYTVQLAHRVMYELKHGPLAAGLSLDHLCFNPPCINPDHLEPVPIAENIRRAGARTTHCPRGHEYTPDNMVGGKRKCRICDRTWVKGRRARARL